MWSAGTVRQHLPAVFSDDAVVLVFVVVDCVDVVLVVSIVPPFATNEH